MFKLGHTPNGAAETPIGRHELLDELERHARCSLSSEKTETLVAEAAEHLDASIRARLELDTLPEIAEREAILEFGNPKEIVARFAAVNRARFQPFFLGCVTFAALGAAFSVLASPVLGGHLVTVAWFVFSVTFGAFVKVSEARRPWLPLFVAVGVFWVGFSALCAAWLRDFSLEGWATPIQSGPVDLFHASLWGAAGAAIFFGYIVLAYRMARPPISRRGHRE